MTLTPDEQLRFWRAFADKIDRGILETLEAIRLEAAEGALAEAAGRIHDELLKSRSIAEAMAEVPDAFPPEVCRAVNLGEQTGKLDEQALEIVAALEAGDLTLLGLDVMSKDMEPARGFTNALILVAIQNGASDIHIDPTEDGKGRVRLRVDGVLRDFEMPAEQDAPAWAPYDQVVSRVKVMAALDTAERRLPQDGRIMLNVSGRKVDLRVSTVPALHGERVCMRILSREAVRLELERIGLLEDDLAKVRRLVGLPTGLVLASGPTGCGKTTLFYSMLNELDRDRCNVMSVEDPIEYDIEGVAQIAVRPQVGLTFARAARSVLRQDPDVILIGEIRDTETANVAAQCALTGHLVLTTLHARTAAAGVKRLLDIGVAPFVVNGMLASVISQRLVRVLCSECKVETEPALHSLPPEAPDLIGQMERPTFYAPRGCHACQGTGYRGRTSIHEILIPDDAVRNVVARSGSVQEIREAALEAGMRSMLGCGLEKAARGITSLQEVARVVLGA